MTKYVAILGGTNYQDLNRVRRFVRSLPPETVIITGEDEGVCMAAEQEAQRSGLGVLIFYALNRDEHEMNRRFDRIVENADTLVRYTDKLSDDQIYTALHKKQFLRPVLVNPEFWEG